MLLSPRLEPHRYALMNDIYKVWELQYLPEWIPDRNQWRGSWEGIASKKRWLDRPTSPWDRSRPSLVELPVTSQWLILFLDFESKLLSVNFWLIFVWCNHLSLCFFCSAAELWDLASFHFAKVQLGKGEGREEGMEGKGKESARGKRKAKRENRTETAHRQKVALLRPSADR